MPISIIQLDERAPAGLFAHLLPEAQILQFDTDDALPDIEGANGIVILGGRRNAYDPTLAPVARLLREATAARVPTLGVCLGAQLLATSHGGRVEVDAPAGSEIGLIDIRSRPEAQQDPVMGAVVDALGRDFSAVSMHDDAVTDLPPGGQWLAASRQYPYQAFRYGSALGVQFHPEADGATYGRWLNRETGVDAAQAEAQWADREPALTGLAEAMIRGFRAQMAQNQ